MSSTALSKRQQARNEKALQDLVHNTPGNNLCADCGARNPAWASWSLGVFLCMRCAAIHRKLGTHISKVKSLSMDSWSNEQVENMKKVGNLTSNKLYNPQNKKPPVPIDADEADSAMERFIRQKYATNQVVGGSRRHNTGSTESDETPPPLPPKTPSRFGFRSASSIFPLSSKAKKDAARGTRDQPVSPQQRNQVSRGFAFEDEDDLDRKLKQLRDMGFTDDQRNAIVLKGVNGNLERTVEALVRLGEGNGRSPLPTPRSEEPPSTSRSLTAPVSGAGLTISRPERPLSPASNNPFDMSPVQPVSSQSTGNIQNRNPYFNNNPFGLPSSQSNDALNQAFQNMSLAPSQPLFPHHTGGAPNQQPQQVVYQQSMTPPIPSIPQNYAAVSFNSNQTYPQPTQQLQPQPTGYNPFFTNPQPQPQPPPPQTLSVNTTTAFGNFGGNPFTRSPTRIVSPSLGQIPEQTQQNFYSSPVQQSPVNNPFFNQMPTSTPSPAPVVPLQTQAQQLQYQQAGFYGQQAAQLPQRPDKASIMALYNYPQLAPQKYQTPTQEQPQQGPASLNQLVQPQVAPASPPQASVSPSVLPGNKNPFLSNSNSPAPPQTISQVAAMDSMVGSRSRDSMMASGLEWTNGRHSPDAFASLSARDLR